MPIEVAEEGYEDLIVTTQAGEKKVISVELWQFETDAFEAMDKAAPVPIESDPDDEKVRKMNARTIALREYIATRFGANVSVTLADKLMGKISDRLKELREKKDGTGVPANAGA